MFDGNRVTAHTRSRYPIFQSPMTWIARAPLVTAVSKAGAHGPAGELDPRPHGDEERVHRDPRRDQPPFGVNLPIRYLQMDPTEEKAIIDWLLGQGIHFVTTSAGDPTRYTKLLKAAGVTVYHATATLRGAQKAVDAGVDGLIVEGAESAGIRNPEEVHTFALLQAVREKVDVPIVAAGGIVDGRGMAAAFALGAEGVTMGTRFVASFESPVHANYKNAIVAAPLTGTIMTDNPPRARSRGLRTPYSVEVAEGKRERLPRGGLIDMLYVQGRRREHVGRRRRERGADPRAEVGAADRRRDDRRLLARDRPAGAAASGYSAAVMRSACSSSHSWPACCRPWPSPNRQRAILPTAIAWPTSTSAISAAPISRPSAPIGRRPGGRRRRRPMPAGQAVGNPRAGAGAPRQRLHPAAAQLTASIASRITDRARPAPCACRCRCC